MDVECRPIETRYRGYRFRSRLEARWAVTFDALGYRWEYEPQGYQLPAGAYLPDFLVEDETFWEIKPARDTPPVRPVLDPRWVDLVRVTGRDLAIVFGIPDPASTAWDLWTFEPVEGGMVRLATRGYGYCRDELGDRWAAALTAGRSARFEHHGSDPSAQPREAAGLEAGHMQRAAGDR